MRGCVGRNHRFDPSAWSRRLLAILLAVTLLVSSVPIFPGVSRATEDQLTGNTVQPVLVVSGNGAIAQAYTKDTISNERSYSLEELKELESITQLYSTINTTPTRSIYLGKGISVERLLQESNVPAGDYATAAIDVVSSDGYTVRFDPNKTGNSATRGKPLLTPAFSVNRYYYPNIQELEVGLEGETYTYSNAENAALGAEPARTMLAWERAGERGEPEIVPTTDLLETVTPLLLMVGQQHVGEQNNPLFNQTVNKIVVGGAVTETAVTIDGAGKTRSEILMMPRADREYTYTTKKGSVTDYARGVPLAVLLEQYDGEAVVSFTAADNYPVAASGKTVAELVNGNYLLAYEKGTGTADLTGIFGSANVDGNTVQGYFTLYGDGVSPAKMINNIAITDDSGIDFGNSAYKHITNGGISGQDGPYDLDAITGATLTIEGPGVVSSVALPIRELEAQNAGAYRGAYTDSREGAEWTLQYEGIRLSHIVHGMASGSNGINLTDVAHRVLLKNRVRQTIAEFTLEEVAAAEAAEKPIIIAYGSGMLDDSQVAPFVYVGAAGYKSALDNDDGPIKLVYDKTAFATDPNPDYTEFGNVAYIYLEQESTPGFKHDTAPYNTPENSQYVLTVTGDKIGREVNYTVEQLENMVSYDADGEPEANGMGYRDEYSLANNAYWYVNQYEGIQLWKLLRKSGLPASAAADGNTFVSFTATDNYKDFDRFTLEQVFNPDAFGFYEKNPADLNDGTYTGDDAIDLRKTGYPVLVAYGVNSYPYVIDNDLDGYMSGLSNDGGPLRIISGKLNYSHANGSKQAKLLDKVIVGADSYYSTHKYNPNYNGLYQQIADAAILNVRVMADGNELKNLNFTVGELEELLYGGSLTSAQLKEAKIKGFYEAYKNGAFYNDLYEGLSLPYFLEQVVELPGYKGTIAFSNGTSSLEMGLESALAFSGCNGTTGLNGLSPVIAYAKNGAPLVNSKKAAEGYEGDVVLAEGTEYEHTITVKNNGGPLAVLFPRISPSATTADSLTSITSITINLMPDKYAHTELPYSDLAGNGITFSGEGLRLSGSKTFTVAEIEGKQTLAVTGDYNIKKNSDSQSQVRYRGIPLYAFLNSTDIGLKPNADQVIVTSSDGTSQTFSLSEVYKSNYVNAQNPAINNLQMILAYGSAPVTNPDPEDGKPLVQAKTAEAGYVEAYGNSGGPIRLIVGQTDSEDINSGKLVKDVVAIEVTASEMVSWNHSSSAVYQQYLDNTFQLQVVDSSNQSLLDKTYTVEQFEAFAQLVERDNITWIGTQEWEGINLWDFVLQEAGSIPGIADPTTVTAFAADGFNKELRSIFGLDALENGIKDGEKRVPIIIGYAVNGYPLVPGTNSEGYTALANNGDGPLRLMTHLNQGACLKQTVKLVVKVGGGTEPEPITEKDFNIYGLSSGTVAMDIKAIKNISQGAGGKVITSYNWFGDHDGNSETPKEAGADLVKGAFLADLLAAQGIAGNGVTVDVVTTDGYSGPGYAGLTLENIASQAYFVAYDRSVDNGVTWTAFNDADKSTPPAIATVRIYRNYDDGSTWYNRVTNVKGVKVTVSGSQGTTIESFTVTGGAGEVVYYVGGSHERTFKGLANGAGKISASYTYNGATHYVKGAYLASLLADAGIPANALITVNTSDGYTKSTYQNISYAEVVAQNYFVAYDVGEGTESLTPVADTDNSQVTASYRIYRNFDEGTAGKKENRIKGVVGVAAGIPSSFALYPADGSAGSLPLAGIRSISMDKTNGLWVSTYGGGVAYKPAGAGGFTVYNKASTPALATAVVSAVAADAEGGVWLTQNASYTDPGGNQGVAYLKDGAITYYTTEIPGTIPHNYVQEIQIDAAGNVWFGSFGGLTRYSPATGAWKTWNTSDGFPAMSVDNLILDQQGGVWCGFYPDGAGTESDPFVGGFAYLDSNENITSYKFTADYDSSLGSSLLAQVWIRDIALDQAGGAWVVASGSYSTMANDGGTLWHVNAQGTVTSYTGKTLLGTENLPNNAELRMVTVDPDGGLWLGTSGNGIFHIAEPAAAVPPAITAHYCSAHGDWPDSALWNNIYSLDFIGSTLYAGSSAGLAYRSFEFENSGPVDPPSTVIATFTVSGLGAADLAYYVGGGYEHTFKGLADNAGKVLAHYQYNGVTHYVKGAYLTSLLSNAGAGEEIEVTVRTSDNYSKDNYLNIPYAELAAKKYFVAYDVGEGTETLSPVADTDNAGVTASYRIYRDLDAGAVGDKDNRIKGVIGISVKAADGSDDDPVPPETAILTVSGKGVDQSVSFTLAQLQSAPGAAVLTKSYTWLNNFGTTGIDTFEGLYLDNLLNDMIGLNSEAQSITVTASDGYYRSFNLDGNELGVYWMDMQGNQMMLAWEKNGSPCSLQLVVGQIDSSHVNKPMWISDVVSIAVKTSTTDSGSGTPGDYEGGMTQTPAVVPVVKADVVTISNRGVAMMPSVAGDNATSSLLGSDVSRALAEMEKQSASGEPSSKPLFEINAVTANNQVKQSIVIIAADALTVLAGTKKFTVLLKTDLGEIELSPATVELLVARSPEPVTVTMARLNNSTLKPEAKELVGSRPIIEIQIAQPGQKTSGLDGQRIKASIPYALAADESPSNLLVYFIDQAGQPFPMALSGYDQNRDSMTFETFHLSTYAVGQRKVFFDDLQNHWAKETIEFLSSRHVINGKRPNVFDPASSVTRAEFMAMLINAFAENPLSDYPNAGMQDVSKDAWYANHVNWAVAQGIISGYGDGRFGPEDPITREQIAVLLENFSQKQQVELPKAVQPVNFTDQKMIHNWAAAAVAKTQQAGLVKGRPDGSFAPLAATTRAEAAALLKSYIDLRLSR